MNMTIPIAPLYNIICSDEFHIKENSAGTFVRTMDHRAVVDALTEEAKRNAQYKKEFDALADRLTLALAQIAQLDVKLQMCYKTIKAHEVSTKAYQQSDSELIH